MALEVEFKGIYSNQWNDGVAYTWDTFLTSLREKEDAKVLEIGSYEGRSATRFVKRYLIGEKAKICCIDTFEGSVEHTQEEKEGLYERFMSNIEIEGIRDKVVVMRGPSMTGLSTLISGRMTGLSTSYDFDVAYVDGSHIACDVIGDAIMAFQLLKEGGIMILDDYGWDKYKEPQLNPRLAIDSFLEIYKLRIEVLLRSYQVVIRKIK